MGQYQESAILSTKLGPIYTFSEVKEGKTEPKFIARNKFLFQNGGR